MIMLLSAPAGRSVHDGIHTDVFSFHYSLVNDAVAILLHLGKEALMAKIDLNSAFRMIPVHCADWGLLGMHWLAAEGLRMGSLEKIVVAL